MIININKQEGNNNMDVNAKRQHEKEIMEKMIHIYCRGNHGTKKGELCSECQKLLEYSRMRTEKCPFMAQKSFCSACKVHCYSKEMKENVKKVMKYSGPRMMFVNPGLTIKHMMVSIKSKKKA